MSFKTYIEALNTEINDIKPIKISGKVTAVKGTIIEAHGINDFVSVGSRCKVNNDLQGSHIMCEVVGFEDNAVY